MDYLVGIDIGGTTVKMGILYLNGDFVHKWEIKTNTEDHGSHILEDIAESLLKTLKEKNIAFTNVVGIGFGVPGPVKDNIVIRCVNLGWENLDIRKEFAKLIPEQVDIVAGNDANMAAFGEASKGHDASGDAIVITLGTGVGGGVIIGGKPIDGANGAAGELGHMKIDWKYNFKCNCGREGCLETVASATGVVRIAKEKLKHEQSALTSLPHLGCKEIYDCALEGDKVANEVVEEVGYYLGYACSLLAVTLNPDCIYLGGGVSKSGKQLTDVVEKYFKKYAFFATQNTKIRLAKLGNDSGMVGAALLALKNHNETEQKY